MDYSMGMTDTSGTPTIGRTVTPQWAGTSDGSWFNDKQDDASSFGTARWNSRRHFDWDTPATVAYDLDKVDPMFDTSSVYSPSSYFGADTPGSTSSFTDAARQRMQDAVYGGLGQYGLGVAGIAGLRSAITGMNPADAITGAISSTLSPNIAANFAGNIVGAATGTQSGWVGNTIAGLASMANPVLGMLATAAGPVIGEGIGKLTGTRKDEESKQAIEGLANTNFLGAAAINRDMRDYEAQAKTLDDDLQANWTNVDPITGIESIQYGYNSPLSAEQSRLRAIKTEIAGFRNAIAMNQPTSSWAGVNQSPQQTKAEFNDAYADAFANPATADAVRSQMNVDNMLDTYADPSSYFNNYTSIVGQASSGAPGGGWNGNPHNLGNPNTLGMNDARSMGLNFEGVTPAAKDLATRSINAAADVGNLGDITAGVRQVQVQGALNRVQPDLNLNRALAMANVSGIGQQNNTGAGGNRTGSRLGLVSYDDSDFNGAIGSHLEDSASDRDSGLQGGPDNDSSSSNTGNNRSSPSSGPNSGRGGHSAGPGGI